MQTEALVINGLNYELLLSRPDMKRMYMNIYGDDTVKVSYANSAGAKKVEYVGAVDDILTDYPDINFVGKYPPATTCIEVLFELADATIVRLKPYNMSLDEKQWIKKKLKHIIDGGII